MANNTRGEPVRSFFDLEAEVLDRRFQTIETLLPAEERDGAAHTGEEGRQIESLLRDFLNRHLPAELRAFSGFILRPATKTGAYDLHRVSQTDKHSKQLDIIVYDRAHYPVYEQFEEFVIVPPEGVVGILSVKKRLYLSHLRAELASLKYAAELCDLPEHARGPHLGSLHSGQKRIVPMRNGVKKSSRQFRLRWRVQGSTISSMRLQFSINLLCSSGPRGFARRPSSVCALRPPRCVPETPCLAKGPTKPHERVLCPHWSEPTRICEFS